MMPHVSVPQLPVEDPVRFSDRCLNWLRNSVEDLVALFPYLYNGEGRRTYVELSSVGRLASAARIEGCGVENDLWASDVLNCGVKFLDVAILYVQWGSGQFDPRGLLGGWKKRLTLG